MRADQGAMARRCSEFAIQRGQLLDGAQRLRGELLIRRAVSLAGTRWFDARPRARAVVMSFGRAAVRARRALRATDVAGLTQLQRVTSG